MTVQINLLVKWKTVVSGQSSLGYENQVNAVICLTRGWFFKINDDVS